MIHTFTTRRAVHDNRALSRASEKAVTDDVPLVVIFVLSPQDYIAHDRGARRIDFTLRNLSSIKVFHVLISDNGKLILRKASLAALNIPLHTAIHSPRVTLPSRIISLLKSFGALHLFANFEYELDELRRDITVCNLAKEDGMQVHLFHDRCVVEPGPIKTGEGRTYTVSVASPLKRRIMNPCAAGLFSVFEAMGS
jgi:deoxyribodipyrimidine photo-lyase